MSSSLYPLFFKPVYKDYMWGGDWIARRFGRQAPEPVCAESWEIADRPEGMSVIENGPLSGRSLHWLMQHESLDLLGYEPARNVFPLLVKILDATKRLSLQVHPDDHSASLHGGEAKSEMWYILDARPGACVFAGLKPDVDESGFRAALEIGNEEAAVVRLDVHAGDVVNVPGGRIHAIGEGCLILEVQQNSDTTYRVSDWGRVDLSGNPREMHLEEALRVVDWSDQAANLSVAEPLSAEGKNRQSALLNTPYFSIERFELAQAQRLDRSQRRFSILFCGKGNVVLAYEDGELLLPPGRSVLIPASCDSLRLIPDDDGVEIVSIRP